MIKNPQQLIKHVTKEITQFTDIAVVGMSGGADSTAVAILCKLALGCNNVYGIHMPYGIVDKQTFNLRSQQIAERLRINSNLIDIGPIVASMEQGLTTDLFKELNQVNKGNIRARARMCLLYSAAHELANNLQKRARVIGTGNLSEDFIGYDTKGGDALADIFPLGELFKSEIYQLLDYFKDLEIITEDMIDRTPSAGLWEGQTDAEEIGYTYDQMEPSIRKYRNTIGLFENRGRENFTEIDHMVVNRYFANKHKHEPTRIITSRQFCE